MNKRIILLSGRVASGKSTLAQGLADRFGLLTLKTRDLLEDRLARRGRVDRRNLQAEGDRLDRRTGGKWVREELDRRLREEPEHALVLVDSVRILNQIEAIRDAYGPIVTHIHLTAPLEVLADRHNNRSHIPDGLTPLTYEEVRENRTERNVERLKDSADVVVDTNRCTKEDVLVRAASHLRLYGEDSAGFVDVIVGGQYGSEGKGQVASYLAKDYDLLVRVGGPNAGHKIFELPEPFTHHLLPSGTRKNPNAKREHYAFLMRPISLGFYAPVERHQQVKIDLRAYLQSRASGLAKRGSRRP